MICRYYLFIFVYHKCCFMILLKTSCKLIFIFIYLLHHPHTGTWICIWISCTRLLYRKWFWSYTKQEYWWQNNRWVSYLTARQASANSQILCEWWRIPCRCQLRDTPNALVINKNVENVYLNKNDHLYSIILMLIKKKQKRK